MNYEKDMWTWFLANACTSGQWGHRSLEREDLAHLETCGIDLDYSSDPTTGTIAEWGNTFNPEVTTPAIKADVWKCNCGQYGSDRAEKRLDLFVPGRFAVGDIIRGVLAVGDRNNS